MCRIEIKRDEIIPNLFDAQKNKVATKTIIIDTKKTLKGFLIDINKINGGKSEYSLIQIFKWFILKEMTIYNELNKLQDSSNILVGLFWSPAKYRVKL